MIPTIPTIPHPYMIELRDLCGPLPPTIPTAASNQQFFFGVNKKIIKKDSVLEEWLSLPFNATKITINTSGSLVAFSDPKNVSIYTIEGKLVLHEQLTVRKVLWHPLGLDDSCLVVLSNGFIRNFWQSAQGLRTDTFEFGAKSLGAQDGPQYATSMTFGTSATGKFCLYLMTEESVFSLCPFLPPTFQLSKSQYNDLLDYAASAHFSYKDTPDSRLYKQQLEWIKAIEPQLKNPSVVENELIYTIESPDLGPICSLGPFRVSPFPKQLYEVDFVDIGALRYASMDFLVVATAKFVLFLLVDEPTPFCWTFSKPRQFDIEAALVQARKIDLSKGHLDITGNLVWWQSTNTTLIVPSFVQALEQSLQGGAPKLVPAEISTLESSVLAAHTLNVSVVPISSLSLGKEFRYIGAPPSAKPERTLQAEAQPIQVSGDVMSLVRDLSLTPSSAVGPIDDSAESLGTLDGMADSYTREIVKLFKSVWIVLDALSLQKSELHSQLQRLAEFTLSKDSKDRSELLAVAIARQDAIAARIRRIDDKCRSLKACQPVGRAEQRWFSELRTTQQKLVECDERYSDIKATLSSLPAGQPCKQDLSGVLARLQGLTNDIEELKQRCIPI